MSSTVSPRRKCAKSPVGLSNHKKKGTILLCKPQPKYNFGQLKTDKHAEKDVKTSDNPGKLEEKGDKKIGIINAGLKGIVKEDLITHTNLAEVLSIGDLINSFPQSVPLLGPQSISIERDDSFSVNTDDQAVVELDLPASNIEQKPKPLKMVCPISNRTGLSLSHSVSDSILLSEHLSPHETKDFSQRVLEDKESGAQNSLFTLSESLMGDKLEESVCCNHSVSSSNPCVNHCQNSHVSTAVVSPNNCNCIRKIKHLEEEKQLLKTQLEVQLQVNQELKKLLVASVGEDLQHRVERLTRDKAILSKEIGDFSRKITDDYENLDKISILADMWRSKYLACRVMSDELASSKVFYIMQFQECQMALQQLLSERLELREYLYNTCRILHQIQDAFDPLNTLGTGQRVKTCYRNVIDLARTSQHLVESLRYRLLPSHVTSSLGSAESDQHDYLTQAEAHAQQLLSKKIHPENLLGLVLSKSVVSPCDLSVDRFHPWTNYDNLTLNVCCQCKGDIQLI